jgi:predicted Rdx family selenoprotein
MLEETTLYRPHPEAMESRLGDETVILHLGSGTYFGLDAVGTIVWERLQKGATPAVICAHVREVFADAPDTVEADVTGFLAQLLDAALIEPS